MEYKESIFEQAIIDLPFIWLDAFIKIFISIMFIELGYLIYKTTGVGSFLILNMLFLKILIFGFIYLLVLSVIVNLVIKYLLPKLKKQREKRRKKFFEELRKELKIK